MAASNVKLLKSYANFTNVFWRNLTRKIKKDGSEFKFFVSVFRKLEKIIIIKSRIVATFENCEIFLPTLSDTCGAINRDGNKNIISSY